MAAQPFDVVRDALLDTGKRRIVAGLPQFCEIGLGEALVLAAQRVGKRDVFDEALFEQLVERLARLAGERAAAIDVGHRQFVETLRSPGSEIEYSGFFRRIR